MRTPEDRARAVGTALILLVLLAIFGGILFWMYSVKLLVIPDRVAELLGIDPGAGVDTVTWDTGELSGVIKNGRPTETVGVSFDLTYENLRDALLSESAPEGFRQTVRVTYSPDSSDARSESRVIFRSGDKWRIERYGSGRTPAEASRTALMIVGSYSMYRLDDITGESRSVPINDSISPENEAGLPSVETLLGIVAEFEAPEAEDTAALETSGDTEAQADEITVSQAKGENGEDKPRYIDGQVAMLRTENGNVYYVSFNDNILGTFEEYYLSLEYRVIISHSTMYGDERLYSFETLDFTVEPDVWNRASLYQP